MNNSRFLGLAAAAIALLSIKKNRDLQVEIERERDNHADYVDMLLGEVEILEDKVNPNKNAHAAPVIFSANVHQGGHTLNQTEIILNCTNTSDSVVEIGDFRANIWLANIKSYRCIPANIGNVKIPAKSTVSLRLYAGSGIISQKYVDVKRALNKLYDGKDSSYMRKGTFIPLAKMPVILNIQYLWFWKGGEEECFAYDVPGSYTWKSAGWTISSKSGYNAAVENQQDKNPSYWEKYDEQPVEDGDDE